MISGSGTSAFKTGIHLSIHQGTCSVPSVSAYLQQGSIICVAQRYRESQVVGSRGTLLLASSGGSKLLGAVAVGGGSLFSCLACSGFWAAVRKFHPYFTGMPVYSSFLRDQQSHLNRQLLLLPLSTCIHSHH